MRPHPALLLLCLLGCGDDDVPRDDAGPPAPSDAFDEVGDFPRTGCDPEAAVSDVDLAGIWHLDLTLAGAPTAVALRIDGAPGDLSALLAGHPAEARAASDLLVRWVDGDQVVALDVCAARPDGTLFGHFARCDGDACQVAEAILHPLRARDEPLAVGLSRVSEYAPPSWPLDRENVSVNIRHRGAIAYLVRRGDGLRILDLADPAAPREVGHAAVALPGEESWNDVKIASGPDATLYALVASNTRGVVVLDVTEPTRPYEVARFPGPGAAAVHTLAIESGRAYLADRGIGGLRVFDVSIPAAPFELGAYIDPGASAVHDLFVADRTVYLGHGGLGMLVVDTGEMPVGPAAVVARFTGYPRPASHSTWATRAGGRAVVLHGDEGFAAHLRILEDSRDLSVLAEYQTRPEVSIHNVMAAGAVALVTYGQDGLRLLDLTDPEMPVEVGHFQTWPGPRPGYGRSFYEGASGVDFDAARGLILVADSHRGLLVLQPSPAIGTLLSP